jgi:acetylornithine deacetylase
MTGKTTRPGAADLGVRAVALLAELVSIDSVNPSLVPGAAGERAIIEHLLARLERSGFTALVAAPTDHPDRPSLLAWHAGSRPGPCLLLNGHVDTVGVSGMDDPFVPRIEGDRLHGRGAADMKGGVAAVVIAAEELARAGAGSVVLALVADEEDRSLGTETLLGLLPRTGLRPDLALVAEPTHLDAATSLRGFDVVEVDIEGRAAHTSQPGEGVDAIAHLGRVLAAVERRAREIEPSGGTLLVSVVSGGSAAFTLADRASATVERRTTPGQDVRGALEEVESLLHSIESDGPGVATRARVLVSREAWRLQEFGPARDFATLLDQALAGVAGRSGSDFAAPYWMEAPLFEAAGIPALVCGPSGGGLHAVDEWVDLRQVRALPAAIITAFHGVAGPADGH